LSDEATNSIVDYDGTPGSNVINLKDWTMRLLWRCPFVEEYWRAKVAAIPAGRCRNQSKRLKNRHQGFWLQVMQ